MPEELHGLLVQFSIPGLAQVTLSAMILGWTCIIEWALHSDVTMSVWTSALHYSVHAKVSRPLVMQFQWMRMTGILSLTASSSQTMLCIVTMSSISSCLTSAWTISSCWETEKESKTRWTILKNVCIGESNWGGFTISCGIFSNALRDQSVYFKYKYSQSCDSHQLDQTLLSKGTIPYVAHFLGQMGVVSWPGT